MKQLFLIMAFLMAMVRPGYAQGNQAEQEPDPARAAVIIDYFTKSPEIPVLYMEKIRSAVIEGFKMRNRVDFIDAEYIPAMAPPIPGAYNPGINREQTREEAIRNSGARYILTGAVSNYKYTRTLTNNKPQYTSEFSVLINAYDLLTGEELAPDMIRLTGRGDNIDASDLSAIHSIISHMNFYIENRFKFETTVLQICDPDAKGRSLSLYVGAGSNMGVRPGDQFMLYVEDNIQGRPIRKELGRITVHSVDGPDIAMCSMKKKQAPLIISAFNDGKTLVAVSEGEALFY